jgi:hypothetical protein
MTIKSNPTRILSTCLLLALPLAACAQDSFDDPDQIGESVNAINGGLDMEDEAPLFGEADLFDSAQLVDEVELTDAMSDDAELVAMNLNTDARRVHVVIRWGQFPVNRDADTPVDWSGRISVNRGALIVRRAIGFEDAAGDRVEQRDNIRSVDFRSRTLPASDGLRLTIIDPRPQDAEPLRLDYSNADGSVYAVDLADLEGEPRSFDVDDRGNRIVVVAMRDRPATDCRSGFIRGRWHQVVRHGGRLLGHVRNGQGDLLGHMRGVYGQRDNGNKVFFGKYIGSDGAFRGIFAGRYEAGHFRGRWLSRSGDIGALGGHYRETIPGPEIGGHFLGRWAASSCGIDVGTGSDIADRLDTP